MQIDVWVPKYNLALEYQGEQHYHDLCKAFGPSGTLALYNDRDNYKKQKAAEQGIRFLAIPYWWDGTVSSLAATLNLNFPDIFPNESPGTPISADIPEKFSSNSIYILQKNTKEVHV